MQSVTSSCSRWSQIAALALLSLALIACGGHGAAQLQTELKPGLQQPDGDLGKALAELDALPVPPGADAARFGELKTQLRAILLDRGNAKLAAAAPISLRSKPGFFSIAGSGGTATATWSYRNEGDYNLDSIVGVTDLTPLGIHFGKSGSSADWATARVADGNVDGAVSVGDLVSIGANFARRVEGYHFQYSSSYSGGSWTTVADIPFASSTIGAGGGRRDYNIDITSGMVDGFYRVVPFDSTGEGIASDPVAYPATVYYETEDNDDGPNANALPVLPFPTPIVDGNLGAGNTFGDVDGDDADIFFTPVAGPGTLDFTLALDGAVGDIDLFLFEQGGTDPIASSQNYGDTEHVSAVVGGGTNYFVLVQLYSGYGEYRLAGSFTPQGSNVAPNAALSATPDTGPAPLNVTLDASASGDTDGTIVKYEYDFGEGGGFQDMGTDTSVVHSYAGAGGYTARVRVTDNGGLTDIATAQITVSGGGEPGTVSGTILTDVGRPLPYVSIVLSDGVVFRNGQADAAGNFTFASVNAGDYTLTPSMPGMSFEPAVRNIHVSGSAVTGQDFTAHFVGGTDPYPFLSAGAVVHPALGTTIDIYIEDGSGITGYMPYMRQAVLDAAPRWNIVGDPWNLFHVEFTDNVNEAEIRVYWVQTLPGDALGIASWSGLNGQINLPMEVQLATYVGVTQVTAEMERKGSIHEVGHALGLWSHSSYETDIMYPIAMQEWPSLRDMWTIYTCYHTDPAWTTGGRGGSAINEGYMEYWTE